MVEIFHCLQTDVLTRKRREMKPFGAPLSLPGAQGRSRLTVSTFITSTARVAAGRCSRVGCLTRGSKPTEFIRKVSHFPVLYLTFSVLNKRRRRQMMLWCTWEFCLLFWSLCQCLFLACDMMPALIPFVNICEHSQLHYAPLLPVVAARQAALQLLTPADRNGAWKHHNIPCTSYTSCLN